MSGLFSKIFSTETPEEKELRERTALVEELETKLARKEMELATERGMFSAFRAMYHEKIGRKYVVLDDLNARIAELLATLNPKDDSAKRKAEELRAQAEASAEEIRQSHEEDEKAPAPDFNPSAELKKIFRQAAKQVHPDRAVDEEDRLYRNEIMAKINVAYEKGDGEAIARLMDDFRISQMPDDVGRKLIIVIRQQAQIRQRIIDIDEQMVTMAGDPLTELRRKAEEARKERQVDLIEELAKDLDQKIAEAKNRLKEVSATLHAALEQKKWQAFEQGKPVGSDDGTPRSRAHLHRTDRGEYVRSKSELVIANILHALALPYEYEPKITGAKTGGKLLPDFVFTDSEGKILIWEHLGMLDKPEYRERWDEKLKSYAQNGFVVGVNLFTSRDERDGSLDSQVIRRMAAYIKSIL